MSEDDSSSNEATVSPGAPSLSAANSLPTMRNQVARPGIDWEEIVPPPGMTVNNLISGPSIPPHVDYFYEVLGRSPVRIPPGTFIWADGRTLWTQESSKEDLKVAMASMNHFSAPFDTPLSRIQLSGMSLAGYKFAWVETGLEVGLGVSGTRPSPLFDTMMAAFNATSMMPSEHSFMLERIEQISTRWLGYGRSEIATERNERYATIDIVVRHFPDSGDRKKPKRYRYGMQLPLEVLENITRVGDATKNIASFMENFLAGYEEEVRSVYYREKHAEELSKRIVPKLEALRQAIHEGRHRSTIDAVTRQITDLEDRLRTGDFWNLYG